MGVEWNPKCGSCKCCKCPLGAKEFTLKKKNPDLIEKESELKADHWIASYPWIRDPGSLPDNYIAVEKMFFSLERRITKNIEYTKMCNDQIWDMLNLREVVQRRYLKLQWTRSLLKPPQDEESRLSFNTSRTVFNASATFQGQHINDYWDKGPDLINNLLRVLLPFS